MNDRSMTGFLMPIVNPTAGWQMMRFILVGSAFAGLYIALATVLTDWFHFTQWVASSFSYLVAIPLAYIAQKKFAFKSRARNSRAFPRYLALQLASLCSASASAYLISMSVNFPTVLVYAASAGIAILANFLLIKFWVLTEDEKL